MKYIVLFISLTCAFISAPVQAQNFSEQQILNQVYATQSVFAYDSSGNVEYIGKATPGSATSAAVWQIQKITYDGSDATEINFAGGSAEFVNIWDNRATYTY